MAGVAEWVGEHSSTSSMYDVKNVVWRLGSPRRSGWQWGGSSSILEKTSRSSVIGSSMSGVCMRGCKLSRPWLYLGMGGG